MMRAVPLAMFSLSLLSFPAAALEATMSYAQCVALVKQNPALAEERARAWQNLGEGRRQCIARRWH